MNFKKYHVSRNLFDKNNTTVHNAYFANDGNWLASEDSRSVLIAVTPNTQYTLSISDEIPIFRIYQTSVSNPTYGNQFQEIIRGTNMKTYTFTTASAAKYIGFQGSASIIDQWRESLMLNLGSEPLPYEPYSSEVWHNTPHYIHNTSTDTITTPAVLYLNDTTATVGLKGDMSQSSTPSPSSPIQPSECGERTSNLFDYQQTQGITDNCFINQSGQIVSNNEYYISYPIYVTSGKTYTWQFNKREIDGRHRAPTVGYYDANDNLISVAQHATTVINFVFTTPQNCVYIKCSVYKRNNLQTEAQLNVGSILLPYEPYGIKIPILSGGVTTPIYLSEPLRKIGDYADTIGADGTLTRNVGVYKMRGTESWILYGGNYFTNYFDSRAKTAYKCICTHLIGDTSLSGGGIWIGSDAYKTKIFSAAVSGVSSDLDTFKSYLADQYSAGTPVTVWYALSSPTTEQITTPTIPVTAGANTLSIGTTLQPSEVTVNYKGWHPVSAVREKSRNILPSAAEQTLTSSGITIRCDGNGRYYINGIATSDGVITFSIPDFEIPVSVGKDGNGTFSLFNTNASSDIYLRFQLNDTKIDDWYLTPKNRTTVGYVAMSGKTTNLIAFRFLSGTSYNGTVSPMFTDDGILPSEYEPYWT